MNRQERKIRGPGETSLRVEQKGWPEPHNLKEVFVPPDRNTSTALRLTSTLGISTVGGDHASRNNSFYFLVSARVQAGNHRDGRRMYGSRRSTIAAQ